MTQNPSSNKSAWVQLYEARRISGPIEQKTPGRPPSIVPRKKVGVTLSQGEISELEQWQERFSSMLGRKVSVGETIGILTRISSTRFSRIAETNSMLSLQELVEQMIGGE